MRWLRALGLPLLVALVVGLAPEARAGWWDDLDKGERVRLADVIAQPKPWRNKRITFTCVYHKPDQVFAPYFTRFHPERHLNLTVWADGAPVWERDAFVADFPHLYLERTHVQRDEALSLATFTRVEVTGEVKDVYRNLPWIQVHGIRKTGGTLGEPVVQAMVAGDNYLRAADPARAEGWYRRALREPSLDATYALRVRKRLGDVLRSTGRAEEAAEVEGGAIVGGSLPPRADGSAAPALPSPETPASEAPAESAAPAAVAESLPGIPAEPRAAPEAAGSALPAATPPGATAQPAGEPVDPRTPPRAPKRTPRLAGVK
jgi:hypothetical protein